MTHQEEKQEEDTDEKEETHHVNIYTMKKEKGCDTQQYTVVSGLGDFWYSSCC
jgi:hypothetical protein